MGRLLPPAGYAVRRATIEDQHTIRGLLRQLHPDMAQASTLPVVRQESRTFLATDGDDVVGLVTATLVDYGVEAYGTVEELVVDTRHRGKHIGKALLDECRSWLRASGSQVVFVSALDGAAAAFYETAGFVRCSGPWLYSDIRGEAHSA
jgi:N-acetylglutamate synthase-like GNAT family acetyltransferase